MKRAVTKSRRATAYDKGQHELICEALKVSPDPDAPGCTAYEGVCVLLTKLDSARDFLKTLRTPKAKKPLRLLNAHHDSEAFGVLPLYGVKPGVPVNLKQVLGNSP